MLFAPIVVLTGIGISLLVTDRATARGKVEKDTEFYLNSLVRDLELEKLFSPDVTLENGHLWGLPKDVYPEAVILRSGSDDSDIFPPPLPTENTALKIEVPETFRSFWQDAERAEYEGDMLTAINSYESLATNPHPQLSKHPRYRLGLLELRTGEPEQSDEIFSELVADIPASDPLHRRAYWHLTQGFMTKRRTRYHPGTNVITQACHAWSSYPDAESRDFLRRFAEQCAEMIHNIFTPVVTNAIGRVARDDNARILSSKIDTPKWRVRSFGVDNVDPRIVMARNVDNLDGGPDLKLLVIWRGGQFIDPLFRRIDSHVYQESFNYQNPNIPDQIASLNFGHSGMPVAS